jgi:hypothetical protein
MKRLILYATLLLLVLASVAEAQANPRCARCAKMVFGDYVTAEGKNFHPGCFVCGACGEIILSRYVAGLTTLYHPDCYNGRMFQSPCAACGRAPAGEHYEDYWGNTYCVKHMEQVAKCDFCARPLAGALTGDGMKLPDGRLLCDVCRPSAVTSESEARALVAEVARRLESFGIEADCREVTVLLLGRDQLDMFMTEHAHSSQHLTGLTEYVSLPGKSRIASTNFYLLYGMPRTQMKSTIAHELMHVWQFQHGLMNIDPALCEGSCNYASYLLLEDMGTMECRFAMKCLVEDDDAIYGAGFRDVKSLVETNGIEAWLGVLEGKANIGAGTELSAR